MDFDMTQAIDNAENLEEEDSQNDKPNCVLQVAVAKDIIETFQLKKGANVIGRLPSSDICLDSKAVSQRHLCIHVHKGYIHIEDLGSSNKTRKGKVTLVPHVRYNLECGEELCIGGALRAQVLNDLRNDDSDTCSESLLPPLEDDNLEEALFKDSVKESSPASQASTVSCSSPNACKSVTDEKPLAALRSTGNNDGTEDIVTSHKTTMQGGAKMDVEFGSQKEFSQPPMPDLNFTQQEMNEAQDEEFRNMPTQALPSLDVPNQVPTQFLNDDMQMLTVCDGQRKDLSVVSRCAQALNERIPNEGDFDLAATQEKMVLTDIMRIPTKEVATHVERNAEISKKRSSYFLVSDIQNCEESLLCEATQPEVYCAATQEFSSELPTERDCVLRDSETPPPRDVVHPPRSSTPDVVPESDEEGEEYNLVFGSIASTSERNVTVGRPNLERSVSNLSHIKCDTQLEMQVHGVAKVPGIERNIKEGGNEKPPAENKMCEANECSGEEGLQGSGETLNNNETGYEENVVMPKDEQVGQNKDGIVVGHMPGSEPQKTKRREVQQRAEQGARSTQVVVVRKSAGKKMLSAGLGSDNLLGPHKDETATRHANVDTESNESTACTADEKNEGKSFVTNATVGGHTKMEDSCSDSLWVPHYIKYPLSEAQDFPSFSQLMNHSEEKKETVDEPGLEKLCEKKDDKCKVHAKDDATLETNGRSRKRKARRSVVGNNRTIQPTAKIPESTASENDRPQENGQEIGSETKRRRGCPNHKSLGAGETIRKMSSDASSASVGGAEGVSQCRTSSLKSSNKEVRENNEEETKEGSTNMRDIYLKVDEKDAEPKIVIEDDGLSPSKKIKGRRSRARDAPKFESLPPKVRKRNPSSAATKVTAQQARDNISLTLSPKDELPTVRRQHAIVDALRGKAEKSLGEEVSRSTRLRDRKSITETAAVENLTPQNMRSKNGGAAGLSKDGPRTPRAAPDELESHTPNQYRERRKMNRIQGNTTTESHKKATTKLRKFKDKMESLDDSFSQIRRVTKRKKIKDKEMSPVENLAASQSCTGVNTGSKSRAEDGRVTRRSTKKDTGQENVSKEPRRSNESTLRNNELQAKRDIVPAEKRRMQSPSGERRTSRASSRPKVLFTGLEDTKGKEIVESLGGVVAQSVTECTHLVTDKFRRTVKTLCCIAMGVPIITVQWLQKCQASGSFIDHLPYLLRDKMAEKNFGFNLGTTLMRAGQRRLLQEWSVHVTGSVKPAAEDMKEIITCAGGRYLPKIPQRLAEKTVIISCALDKKSYSAAAKKSIPVVSAEFLLTGLLQYKLDIDKYVLFAPT